MTKGLDFFTQLKIVGLPFPDSEYLFHPNRKWRIDYCWPVYKLAVEVDGGAFIGGRHSQGKGFFGDMEKYNELAIQRFYLLRFTPRDIDGGKAVRIIRKWFEARTGEEICR